MPAPLSRRLFVRALLCAPLLGGCARPRRADLQERARDRDNREWDARNAADAQALPDPSSASAQDLRDRNNHRGPDIRTAPRP